MQSRNNEVFHRWMTMLADDSVRIDADDINAEAIENLWCFSPTDEESPGLDAAEVQRFVESFQAQRRQWLAARRAPPMRFYAWHDAQARQLRMSTVSASHGRLPFGCAVAETTGLGAVVREIVEGDWRNLAYGDGLLDESPDDEPAPFTLKVFVAEMGPA